ncbi:hypothetical protein [Sebaldella sp. S0638]|uniref:hypothetical protein n=1 Tax=Sebaldella sp. S0638 TaxID=2957809 RepID=UPI0020A0DE26|nr:hypothetical protein [Sebaldella sp. S0638]MCP1224971.1 hypothetical protein [Sebaldella sp. S0638]
MKGVKLMIWDDFGHRCPEWINYPKEKEMTLSKKATAGETDFLIIELLSRNYIDFSNGMDGCFEDFIERSKKGMSLGGGIIFYEGKNEITPGCCNDGIGNFKGIIKEIRENEPMIWLGHDPYPVFEYLENEIVVWADDCLGIWEEPIDKSGVLSIIYEKNDLYNKLSNLDNDVRDFFTRPFYDRINYYDKNYSDKLVDVILTQLKIKL